MSLHRKIVWIFIGIAILPLLIVAGISHRQSLLVVDLSTEVRLADEVAVAARLLAGEARETEEALRVIASIAPADADGAPSPATIRALEEAGGGAGDRFQVLKIVAPSGRVLARSGPDVASRTRCGPEGRTSLVREEVPWGKGGDRLIGEYWLGVPLRAVQTAGLTVLDGRGRILLAPSCEARAPSFLAGVDVTSSDRGVVRLGGEAERRHAAYATVEGEGWTAVATASSGLRAPIARLFRNYWLFVLGLAATTMLAFHMLLGRATRSIEDLTRAAERMGEGDLDPWLPTPTSDEVGRLTLAFSRMADRLRDTLEQVDRSGRLAVVGQLSSYLAHEIRNPLSSVKMNLQRLQRWHRQGQLPDRCQEPVEISLKEVDRLSVAVSNVLQLSRPQHNPPRPVAMHDVVKEAGKLLDNEFARRGVRLRWELDARADRVLARPGQIKAAVINLMLNAMEAQPGGGELSIRSELVPGSEREPGPRLELRFRDQGPGVPPEVRDHIFDPFFTTKHGGSGIGLAVSIQSVRDNGGDLYLEEPLRIDQGAEFVMTFPLAAVSSEVRAEDLVEPRLAPWIEKASVENARPAGTPGGGVR